MNSPSTMNRLDREEILASLMSLGEDPTAARVDALHGSIDAATLPAGERGDTVRAAVDAARVKLDAASGEAGKLPEIECTGDGGTYSISAVVKTDAPIRQLRSDLQAAYDHGAAGFFEIEEIDSSTKRIVFERQFGEDYEMLVDRIAKGSEVSRAACEQLADEFSELSPEGSCLAAVLASLRDPRNAVVSGLVDGTRKLQQDRSASVAGSTLQGPRRDPMQVGYFTPYMIGDVVQLDGEDWQVKHDTPGWYLTNTGTWKGEHPTIHHINSMNELIHCIEQALQAAQMDRKLPEPAKVLVHQITADDVLEVLRKHSLQVANAAGRPFDAIAEELFDDLDFYRLERAALLAGDQPSAQSTAIREDIADQLVEHGVLNLPQKTLEQARAALISEWKWASDNSRDLWQSAAKTILDRILKNAPAGALILLKADLEQAGTLGVGIYYERAVKSVQALVDMPRELVQSGPALSAEDVAAAFARRGEKVTASRVEVMRNWVNGGNLLGSIPGKTMDDKIEAMLAVRPQECTFLEFIGLSTIQRLHDLGQQDTSFVTFNARALVTVDEAGYDGLRAAHRLMVHRSLWSHTADNAAGREPLPPKAVLDEYPELRDVFPEQFAMAESRKLPEAPLPPAGEVRTLLREIRAAFAVISNDKTADDTVKKFATEQFNRLPLSLIDGLANAAATSIGGNVPETRAGLPDDPVGARLFFEELLAETETLGGLADQYGVDTLTDLMYLQHAIMSGTSVDHRQGESAALDVLKSLPSGDRWLKHVKVEIEQEYGAPSPDM
ncbi:hypothetical protein R70006_05060 [Paraburkholderia domus]|uniref:hypothetical protein n=1 Tax=Paraburkholderia domus TaxID=2793075 RepID=UPI0019112DB5|nr:hypothetical protein [Paraburkholderia domus]MBK5051703.1 hypothetical protein [Burkholderia sp. R-70006]CAE6795638.1 hypothetical protein R70006_05060 [Paraburkholderia domus]